MPPPVNLFLCLLVGYAAGSIPFAVLITKAKGVDIFSIGSGNPGATNVLRALGKPYGYTCFLLDALKGVAAVALCQVLAGVVGFDPMAAGIAGLVGSILGHSFSIWLRFRGGKGVATTVGGVFALLPMVMLVGVLLWVATYYAFRYVSLASIVLGLSLPVSAFFFNPDRLSIGLCLVLAILIVVRHKSNIQRLLAGTENRAGKQ